MLHNTKCRMRHRRHITVKSSVTILSTDSLPQQVVDKTVVVVDVVDVVVDWTSVVADNHEHVSWDRTLPDHHSRALS